MVLSSGYMKTPLSDSDSNKSLQWHAFKGYAGLAFWIEEECYHCNNCCQLIYMSGRYAEFFQVLLMLVARKWLVSPLGLHVIWTIFSSKVRPRPSIHTYPWHSRGLISSLCVPLKKPPGILSLFGSRIIYSNVVPPSEQTSSVLALNAFPSSSCWPGLLPSFSLVNGMWYSVLHLAT